MTPRPGPPQSQKEFIVSDSQLEQLAAPLTVLHANIQLLKRRLLNGNAPDPDALVRTLEKLEDASRTIITRLRVLDDTPFTGEHVHGKMENIELRLADEEGERDG